MRTTRRQNGAGEKSPKDAKMEDKARKSPKKSKAKETGKKVQLLSGKPEKKVKEISRRSSLRSSGNPDMLYDFKDDTPKVSNIGKQENNASQSKGARGKEDLPNQKKKSVEKTKDPKSTVEIAVKKVKDGVTNKENNKKNNVKKKFKPLLQPNFDDVSPIAINHSKVMTRKSGELKTPVTSVNRRPLRSANKSDLSFETPTVSIIEPEKSFNDDSAIFMSPRQSRPRFTAAKEKTSTPAIVIKKKTNKRQHIKQSKPNKLIVKDTSTPCEIKAKVFTRLKKSPDCSPVQRSDTPTSDYASMDSIVVPSPSIDIPNKRKRGRTPTPAFSLDDESEPEPLNLNRSINLNYSAKKTKKKIKASNYNVERVDEWANKVNSELEDIENFELSIED